MFPTSHGFLIGDSKQQPRSDLVKHLTTPQPVDMTNLLKK